MSHIVGLTHKPLDPHILLQQIARIAPESRLYAATLPNKPNAPSQIVIRLANMLIFTGHIDANSFLLTANRGFTLDEVRPLLALLEPVAQINHSANAEEAAPRARLATQLA